jgi:heptaprenyl diphosphate synthase
MADNDPADKELILKLNKPISDDDLPNVILELREHKALKKVQDYLSQVATEANDLLIDLPAGAAKEALNNLTFALVNRST